MKIVINLPDVDYEYIKNGSIVPIKYDNLIYEAIRNGTVLPDGHGELVDRTAILDEMALTPVAERNFNSCVECVECAPTIIGADK